MKLALFDIDGTILLTDGAGRRAIQRALVEVFGGFGPAEHKFGGKTDRQIVRELMRLDGHGDEHIDDNMDELLARYVDYLHEELTDHPDGVHVMPGVRELLDALGARDDVVLGLLTGNLVEGARAKLRAAGIDPARFLVGAFGSDHEHRNELPHVAQRRARHELGVIVDGDDIVVIGDTPADIDCGRAVGARTIAVATGGFSVDALRAHEPTFTFADLSDTDAAVSAIVGAIVGAR